MEGEGTNWLFKWHSKHRGRGWGNKISNWKMVREKKKKKNERKKGKGQIRKVRPAVSPRCLHTISHHAAWIQRNRRPNNAETTSTQRTNRNIKANTTAREGQSKHPFLCKSLSLPVQSPLSTFKIFSHVNTVVGKRLACDITDKNGAVGTCLGVFAQWSCLKHSALHALLKVHTLKLCPAQLPGKGARQHLKATFACGRGGFR